MRSPADPMFDPFWRLANESGITVCYHGGETDYTKYLADWGESDYTEAFRPAAFRGLVSADAMQDTFANHLAHGLFHRFPNLRMASIETGSAWVFHLFEKLTKSYGQMPAPVPRGPAGDLQAPRLGVAVLRGRARPACCDLLGADHILMGSDFPHVEGLAEPRLLHQGPGELRLHPRAVPDGHARQRLVAVGPPPGELSQCD